MYLLLYENKFYGVQEFTNAQLWDPSYFALYIIKYNVAL